MPTLTEVENMSRERQGRLMPIEAARQGANLAARQEQTGNPAPNQSGYFDDATGEYKPYFRFGVSTFGDGSVFR